VEEEDQGKTSAETIKNQGKGESEWGDTDIGKLERSILSRSQSASGLIGCSIFSMVVVGL
jgi:hypothetical protein